MIIKFAAVIITFSLSTVFFSSNHMTPLSKGVIKSEIKQDDFRGKVMRRCKACYPISKDAVGPALSCGEKMLEYEPKHTVLIDKSPRPSPKSYGKNSLITSDHKTNCEYINLFGKQIGGVPRA
jgi:hypothetical protein